MQHAMGVIFDLDGVLIDTGSNFDTENGRFVAPKAGKYLVHGCVQYAACGIAGCFELAIWKNLALYTLYKWTSAYDSVHSISITDIVILAENEYVRLFVQNEGEKVINCGSGNTYMDVTFVAE